MTEGIQPNAILRGGPAASFPDNERIRFVPDLGATVKVLCGNRYEHYHASAQTERHDRFELHVFVWSGRTYVAE